MSRYPRMPVWRSISRPTQCQCSLRQAVQIAQRFCSSNAIGTAEAMLQISVRVSRKGSSYDDGPIQETSLLRRLPFLNRRVLAALSLDEAQPFDLLLPTADSPEGHCLEVSLDHDCLKPRGTCLAESPFGCLDQSTPKTTATVRWDDCKTIYGASPAIPCRDH
jgi:hypothetical protein